MAYEIFWGAGSPYSWRALLALEVKQVEYQSRLLEFSRYEHQTPEMLSMNPRGQVPVLRDGDTSIYESIAIVAYLDSKHTEVPLLGTTTQETGYIWQRVFELENYLCKHIFKIVRPIFFDDIEDNIHSIEKAADLIHPEFNKLQTYLQSNRYLAGDNITAADIVLFPIVQSLTRAMFLKSSRAPDLDKLDIEQHYSHIANWITRIESIPGYERTYPPNWIQ